MKRTKICYTQIILRNIDHSLDLIFRAGEETPGVKTFHAWVWQAGQECKKCSLAGEFAVIQGFINIGLERAADNAAAFGQVFKIAYPIGILGINKGDIPLDTLLKQKFLRNFCPSDNLTGKCAVRAALGQKHGNRAVRSCGIIGGRRISYGNF